MTQYLLRKARSFVAILGAGVLLALVIWIATNVFNIALPGVDTSPLEVRVIAAPAAYDWVRQSTERFNAEGRRLNRRPVTVTVVEQDGIGVYSQAGSAGLNPAPAAWIAEGAFMLDMANLASRQASGRDAFTSGGVVAQSPLMWGGFADRINTLDARFSGLNWRALHDASAAAEGWSSLGGRPEWGFFKLALPDPRKSSEGLAALLLAAAEYHGRSDVSAADITDGQFQAWAQSLIDAVPNFANLGADPAGALAVRGPSAGDAGLLLEADWLLAAEGLSNRQPIVLRYASPTLTFDLTFAVFAGTPAEVDPAQRDAALIFRDFLLEARQQTQAEAFGLRPASGRIANPGESLFAKWALLGLSNDLDGLTNIHVNADAVLAALRWVERAAGR